MTGRPSRRTLLGGGAALGTSLLTGTSGATGQRPRRLVPDYRPSQPTGWPELPGQPATTVGGHVAAREFGYGGRRYRIGLLPTDPVYEDLPGSGFRTTLAGAFADHYAFHYLGGLRGRDEFRVQSYSVYAREDTPGTAFGCNLYVVYAPDRRHGDPAADDRLQWIQVVRRTDPTGELVTELDNLWRANPFYLNGGLTSVHGAAVVSFQDAPQIVVQGDVDPAGRFEAETFLARDTGRRDPGGKAVVDLYGGIRWGWQVEAV